MARPQVYGPIRLGERAVILHGGAGGWKGADPKEVELAAAKAAKAAADSGLSLESVVEAVAALENSGVFNAGVGSVLTLDGRVQMDAGVMYGDMRAGAVAATSYPRNPIRLADWIARNLFHVIVAGADADALAERLGLPRHPGPSKRSLERWKQLRSSLREERLPWLRGIPRWILGGDTVGAVAASRGEVAAAASTGGILLKLPGRVGDSPIPGAGFYAENGVGGCSATGIGETILLGRPCLHAVELLRQGVPVDAAVEAALARHTKLFGEDTLGLILLDAEGNAAAAFNTEAMPIAYVGSEVEPRALLLRREGLHKH